MLKHFRYNNGQGDWPIVIFISLATTFTLDQKNINRINHTMWNVVMFKHTSKSNG